MAGEDEAAWAAVLAEVPAGDAWVRRATAEAAARPRPTWEDCAAAVLAAIGAPPDA